MTVRLNEHRARSQGLADLLLYDSLVDDGVMLLQDGALMAAWSFRGPDMASATNSEMAALSARLNSTLKLGTGWMIQCDAIRSRAPEYPEPGSFPDPITNLIDEERRQQFSAEGTHFESEYFLSLTYLPPAQNEERVKGWMFDGASQPRSAAEKALDYFRSRVDAFADVFGSLLHVQRLTSHRVVDAFGCVGAHDNLLRYVHRCVTTIDHPITRPNVPSYLHDLLATEDFIAGMAPRIGSKMLRIIAIDGFPRLSFPGILGALDNLAIEYRWHTRAILLDPEEARGLLDKTRRKWRSKIRGWKDQLLRIETGPINLYAQEMAADAEEAMGVASSGDVQFCVYNAVIICAEESEDRLDEAGAWS
jgi:type IV secretion system protein TrbE